MNEAQLPEVTNVPNDLCMARVALFLPGYDSMGGQWWRWCEPRGCFRQPACRHWLMGYVRPPPLIFTSFLLTPVLSRQCRGSYHPLRVLSLGMGDARRNTPPLPFTPLFSCPGVNERKRGRGWKRGRGEKVKVKASGVVKEHTRLVCSMKYDSYYKVEERKDTFWGYILSHDGNKLQS